LVKDYLGVICVEGETVLERLAVFEKTLSDLHDRFADLVKAVRKDGTLDADKKQALLDAVTELADTWKPYEFDRTRLLADLERFRKKYANNLPEKNDAQHTARKVFDPIVERIKGRVKQVDLLYKLSARVADDGGELAAVESVSVAYDRRAAGKLLKQLDEQRKAAVEQLKHTVHFHRQVVWLQERFPTADLVAVPGLVKLVDRKEIEAAEWSLTPGRYIGVAPPEEAEDFDFEQTMRDIHTELNDLNRDALDLTAKIQKNFEDLGI
jgi:type I restriction enzyme M protein